MIKIVTKFVCLTSTLNYSYKIRYGLPTLEKVLKFEITKKIYIYNTRSEKNTVFDFLMVTTLAWNNVPRSPFRSSFGLEPVSTLSSGLFLAKQCPLLERGTTLEPHTPVLL